MNYQQISSRLTQASLDAEGFVPTQLVTFEQQFRRRGHQVESALEEHALLVLQGLAHLQELDSNVAAQAFGNLRKLAQAGDEKAITAAEAISENATAFDCAVDEAKDLISREEFQQCYAVMAVLFDLYTGEPDLFALLGTALWHDQGVAVARDYYEQAVAANSHPLVAYYAADCFAENGERDLAYRTLVDAKSVCDTEAELEDIEADIIEFLEELENGQS